MLKLFVIIRLAADIYTHMHKYKGKQIQNSDMQTSAFFIKKLLG